MCVRSEKIKNGPWQWCPSRVIHAEPVGKAVARVVLKQDCRQRTLHGAGLIKAYRQHMCAVHEQVFDVELHAVHSCRRRQFAMFSDVVCDS